MVHVSSSHIEAVGYDPNTAVLEIQFKDGSVYDYYDVPSYEYDGLLSAESKGTYAHQNIYKKYRQQKIG
ncbi:MAG: KTSC domain-containing protein [Ignavibacteriales bacterium]|nr:KTSC domain-containing protein [Ignavibacteriales bacterium]